MKRLSFVLALVLLLSLSVGAFAGNWIDGTYEGYSDAGARSFQYAKVYIENGEIVAVTLREFTDKYLEKDPNNYNWPQFGEALRTLGARFVEAQGTDVDIVTGATGSSTGWIQAVERALVKASPDKPSNKYFDGTFMGRSHYDGNRGYYKVVWVTIENDKIVDYKVQRVLPDGTIQDPAEYNWPLEQAREAYKKAAMESTPGFVDTISGATGLTYMSNIAVRDALDAASIQ
ncbi:MAG: FMN-binding protein [Firmicutes bacterium]|nr:FMN-binding protein [Bacillota bacterium]